MTTLTVRALVIQDLENVGTIVNAPDPVNPQDVDTLHARMIATNLLVPLTQKGAANGVASLDGSGKVPAAQLPAVAINNVFVVSSLAAMLALAADVGDVAVQSAGSTFTPNTSYMLQSLPASTQANWIQISEPGQVTSVAGRIGAVTLAFTDLSGVATTAQIGTGTPAAGKYVDGAAGAWTALPTSLPPSGTAGGDLTGTYPNPTIGGSLRTLIVNSVQAGALGLYVNPSGPSAVPVQGQPFTSPRGTWYSALSRCQASRVQTATTGHTTNTSTAISTVSVSDMPFVGIDVGSVITDSAGNLPVAGGTTGGTRITAVSSNTAATVSKAATGTSTTDLFTVGNTARQAVIADSEEEFAGAWTLYARYMSNLFPSANPHKSSDANYGGYQAFAEATFPVWTLTNVAAASPIRGAVGYAVVAQNGGTITGSFTGERFSIFWPSGGTGTWAVTVDGVSAGTIDTSTGWVWDSAVFVYGTHTLLLTATGTPLADAIFVYTGNYLSGVQTYMLTHTGWQSADMYACCGGPPSANVPTPNTDLSTFLTNLAFHEVICATGVNDGSTGAYTTGMGGLLASVRSTLPNASIDLWVPMEVSGHSWMAGLRAVARSLSITNSIPLIDAFEVIGDLSAQTVNTWDQPHGWTFDGVHLSAAGAEMVSQSTIDAILGSFRQAYPTVAGDASVTARSSLWTSNTQFLGSSGTATIKDSNGGGMLLAFNLPGVSNGGAPFISVGTVPTISANGLLGSVATTFDTLMLAFGAGVWQIKSTVQTTGQTGAATTTQWAGGTSTGAPVSGTFVAGAWVVTLDGHVWICTVGGTPGTWVDVSSTYVIPAGTVTGTMIAANTITNTNVNSAAAIAVSKLASGAEGVLGRARGTGSGTPVVTSWSSALASMSTQAGGAFNWNQVEINSILDVSLNGLPGATIVNRWVGGTTTLAPTGANPFAAGDWVTTRDGRVWICTAGGSPGTWVDAGAIAAGTIVDSMVSSSAAIALSKLANPAANTVLVNATNSAGAVTALAMGASTILARLAAGNIVAATPAQVGGLMSFDQFLAAAAAVSAGAGFDWTWSGGGSGGSLVVHDGNTGFGVQILRNIVSTDANPNYRLTDVFNVPIMQTGLGGASATDTAFNLRDAAGVAGNVSFQVKGLTGATSASRIVGATAGTAAPSSGTWAVGDLVIGQNGSIWICTVAGTSGTWVQVGSVLASALTVANGGTGAGTLTGVVIGNGTSAFTTVTAPAGAIVGTTDTQTLTNKSLTDPALQHTLNVQAANYTFVLTDKGQVVQATKGTAGTLTIPPQSSVTWPALTILEFIVTGAGTQTLTAGAGVTLTGKTAYATGTHGWAYRTGSDTWVGG